jgi:endo-1,4-beta-xylanase
MLYEQDTSASVEVLDITPPVLTVSVTPNMLMEPNHKLVDISASITVVDECDANPQVKLVSISSDETDNGLGDGETSRDIQDADIGTDDHTFRLRNERSGLGDGRVYTIVYEASDASGNTAQEIVTVEVIKSSDD